MIDVRELRINSHVLHNGKRFKVIRISDMGIVEIDGYIKEEEKIDPIPITPNLLKELGFEKIKDPRFDYAKRYENNRGLFVSIITDGVIRIESWDGLILRGNMICQYLHEMEQFVYLTTKHELI